MKTLADLALGFALGLAVVLAVGCHNSDGPNQTQEKSSEERVLESMNVEVRRDDRGVVVEIDAMLAGAAFEDKHLLEVMEFDRIQSLVLSQTNVTADGLQHLKRFSRLQSLYLDDTRIGDDAIAAIIQLPQLQELSLTNTLVTDKGIAQLGRLKQLRSLVVYETKASSAGIAKLRKRMPKTKIWD